MFIKLFKQVGPGQVQETYINLDLVQQFAEKDGYTQFIFQGGGNFDAREKIAGVIKKINAAKLPHKSKK